jgi:hypothetical protein
LKIFWQIFRFQNGYEKSNGNQIVISLLLSDINAISNPYVINIIWFEN